MKIMVLGVGTIGRVVIRDLLENWDIGLSYAPSEEEWARLEEEAIKMIDGKRGDRRWWVKNIVMKPVRSLLASTVYYLARGEGKNIPQRGSSRRGTR